MPAETTLNRLHDFLAGHYSLEELRDALAGRSRALAPLAISLGYYARDRFDETAQHLTTAAGFAAGRPLYLYRLDLDCRDGLGCWSFLAHIGTPAVDAQGEAIYNLTTAPDDPPGIYTVVTDPVPGFLARNFPQVFVVEE